MKSGRKLGKISLEILKKASAAGIAAFNDLVDMGNEYPLSRYRARYNAVYNLRRQGYLQIENNKKNQSFFHLTPKGKLQILKYLHLEKLQGKKWDGRWRIIIFDIPESLKKWREYLRNHLKNLGFRALQESVYITPYPVTGELDEILNEWGMRKYFRYITVLEIDGENVLKKKFGLK